MTPQVKAALREVLVNVWYSGYRASIPHARAKDIDDGPQLQAVDYYESVIQPEIERLVLGELLTIEARSDCIEDGCGLDATLLRDNFLRRIDELKAQLTQSNPQKGESPLLQISCPCMTCSGYCTCGISGHHGAPEVKIGDRS